MTINDDVVADFRYLFFQYSLYFYKPILPCSDSNYSSCLTSQTLEGNVVPLTTCRTHVGFHAQKQTYSSFFKDYIITSKNNNPKGAILFQDMINFIHSMSFSKC